MRKKPKYAHIPIAFQEALYTRDLSLRELRVLGLISSESFGWQREATGPLSRAEIALRLGMSVTHAGKAIKRLLEANALWVARTGRYGINLYQINIDIDSWDIPVAPRFSQQ